MNCVLFEMTETSLTLEFTGGSEFLVGNQKMHQVSFSLILIE